MDNGNKRTIHERITAVETTIDINFKAIFENHFPSLEKKVDKVMNKFWWMITLLIANLFTVILTLIL